LDESSLLSRNSQRSRRQPSLRMSPPQLGLLLFLISLSMLFAASLVAYVITRHASPDWRAGMPGLPLGLLGSTALIIGLSGSMHWALSAIRKNRAQTLKRALWLALLFAIAFLLGQTMNWRTMAAAELTAKAKTLYPFTFFLLTGLHALHVLGGFVPHAVVLSRAARQQYSSSRYEGVKLCAQYWDFLGLVWLVLLTTLWLFT
jgi:cytochrome c oxidase subunit 3